MSKDNTSPVCASCAAKPLSMKKTDGPSTSNSTGLLKKRLEELEEYKAAGDSLRKALWANALSTLLWIAAYFVKDLNRPIASTLTVFAAIAALVFSFFINRYYKTIRRHFQNLL